MKLKEGFILREVAGQKVVIPSGNELNLNMMITLNDTGAFLWEKLQAECDVNGLVEALLAEYDVDEQTARNAVESFIAKLNDNEFLAVAE